MVFANYGIYLPVAYSFFVIDNSRAFINAPTVWYLSATIIAFNTLTPFLAPKPKVFVKFAAVFLIVNNELINRLVTYRQLVVLFKPVGG